jgi:hypothetical protein
MRTLHQVGSLLRETLHEIFDEAAYTRFLVRNHMASSREAYAEFLLEQDRMKARRPRCC